MSSQSPSPAMESSQSMGSKIARGATWMLLFRLSDRALGFISTVILARVLVPADFGVVAMAASVITLIELTGAFSLEVRLIQRTHSSRQEYDTVWTLRLLFGAFGAAATVAVAWYAASFYGDDRLVAVLLALAANWLVGTFENIGVVDFRRRLDFRREYAFLISKRLVAVPVTIAIAVLFHTYWAMIAGTAAGTVAAIVLSYAMHPYRPRLCLQSWREQLSFSVWLFVNNLLSFLQLRLAHFIIGRTQGAEALGIFTVATDFAALASSEITAPVNRAVLPGLARLAGTIDGMKRGMLQVIGAVLLVTLPAAFGMAAIAKPIVLVVLGDKWIAVVPVLQTLAFAGALQSLTANNHSAYLAAGKSHVPVLINTAFIVALVPLLFLLSHYGVVGVAFAQLGAMAVSVFVSVLLMKRHLRTTTSELMGAVWRPLFAASAMGIAVHLLDEHQFGFDSTLSPYVRLVLGVASGVGVYLVMAASLWLIAGRAEGLESRVYERAMGIVRRSMR